MRCSLPRTNEVVILCVIIIIIKFRKLGIFVEHFCIDFNFIPSFQFFDEYDKRNFETRSKFTKCCVKDPVDVFLSHHEQNNIWLFVNHNVQSIRFIRERDPNWFVGTDKQDYLSCEFKKKIEYSPEKILLARKKK